jgi:hypothetical protein
MNNALHRFHNLKDIFLPGCIDKRGKAKGNALRTKIMNQKKAEEKSSLDNMIT